MSSVLLIIRRVTIIPGPPLSLVQGGGGGSGGGGGDGGGEEGRGTAALVRCQAGSEMGREERRLFYHTHRQPTSIYSTN